MGTYKTPGVYVEEVSTLPPSVAEVATAIPAFIGYTEFGSGQVARISTLLEYETIFGYSLPRKFVVTASVDTKTDVATLVKLEKDATDIVPNFLMHDALNLYFKNGGGSCYIISVGSYSDVPSKEAFEEGLIRLEKEDEPTLIVLTDAVILNEDSYYSVCEAALLQCNKLGDRFAIFDVLAVEDGVDKFRKGIGTNYLKYGAAYYPNLLTTLSHAYKESEVTIKGLSAEGDNTEQDTTGSLELGGDNGITISYTGSSTHIATVTLLAGTAANAIEIEITEPAPGASQLSISNIATKNGSQLDTAWTALTDKLGFDVTVRGDGSETLEPIEDGAIQMPTAPQPSTDSNTLDGIKASRTGLYNTSKAQLALQRVTLPPSSAIAGIYASTDRNRGVWKAPANVSVASVIGPTVKITHEEQGDLNVDANAGKSINAIRSFAGKGTLVWGARTLAGNDNEWRYVSVRRLFNTIEESTRKSTAFAIFEPNDATTWLKVKAMIEAYLYGLWQQGALAGPTPEAAYFVEVGLGKTMTPQDVLEGRMIVQIGIAAVRPAEFIILRFTHKLQEA